MGITARALGEQPPPSPRARAGCSRPLLALRLLDSQGQKGSWELPQEAACTLVSTRCPVTRPGIIFLLFECLGPGSWPELRPPQFQRPPREFSGLRGMPPRRKENPRPPSEIAVYPGWMAGLVKNAEITPWAKGRGPLRALNIRYGWTLEMEMGKWIMGRG